MNIARRLFPALIAAGVLSAGGALAAEPEAMATAPVAAAPTAGVADQIDAYLRASPAAALPTDGASGVTSGAEEPRKVHGMVDVAVGSNGYRSAYVRSDLPVGRTGTLSIAVGESKINGRGYGGYGGYGGGYGGRVGAGGERQSLGLALSLGEPALDPRDRRCRPAGEEQPDARSGWRFEGGRPSACHAADARTSPQ